MSVFHKKTASSDVLWIADIYFRVKTFNLDIKYSTREPLSSLMLSGIVNQYHQIRNNRALMFLGSVVVLYLIWEFLYRTWFLHSTMSVGLCEILGRTSGFLFSLAGYEVTYVNKALSLNQQKVVYIGNTCNGLEFFGLFTCFVLAFPGSIKSKAWFLPAGILFIHLLNVIRVQFLILNYYFFEASFDFNHKYTFNIVVYGFTLIIWLWWAKKQIQKNAPQAA